MKKETIQGRRWGIFSRLLPALGVLLMPKCGLCLAAYLNLFSFFGISLSPCARWVLPLLAGVMLTSLIVGWIKARRMNDHRAFLLSVAGMALLLAGKVRIFPETWLYIGFFLLLAGSIIQLVQSRRFCSRTFSPKSP